MNGWGEDLFRRWKCSFEKVDREFLSEDELSRLRHQEFRLDRLDRVRALFLFSCYTGLSFIDTMGLTKRNVWIGDGEGTQWIITTRQKTKKKIKVP